MTLLKGTQEGILTLVPWWPEASVVTLQRLLSERLDSSLSPISRGLLHSEAGDLVQHKQIRKVGRHRRPGVVH